MSWSCGLLDGVDERVGWDFWGWLSRFKTLSLSLFLVGLGRGEIIASNLTSTFTPRSLPSICSGLLIFGPEILKSIFNTEMIPYAFASNLFLCPSCCFKRRSDDNTVR
jgi:hypothetical protein